jgi:hypothetical protein
MRRAYLVGRGRAVRSERESLGVQRLAPAALLVAALLADGGARHELAFYLLLGAIVVTAHAALDAYGALIELSGSAPGLALARLRTALAALGLVLALVAAAARAPTLGETVPALGLSAVVGALALLLLHGALRTAR